MFDCFNATQFVHLHDRTQISARHGILKNDIASYCSAITVSLKCSNYLHCPLLIKVNIWIKHIAANYISVEYDIYIITLAFKEYDYTVRLVTTVYGIYLLTAFLSAICIEELVAC